MKWYTLFSQTGSEINEISKKIGRFPDMVLCNKQDDFESITGNLIGRAPITFTDNKPTVKQYLNYIPEDVLVTMHGWMRIVPGEVCEKREIYNGHPGLITKYPELKGKDPQQKAFDLGHKDLGCVLHRATAELDGGPIIAESETITLNEESTMDDVFEGLHKASVNMWVKFLTEKLHED
jgi:folate-dependent phosphoribosylglycinamide formyltransferase PurN